MKSLRIVHVASEVSPYSKTGGLADVAAALPKWLGRFGHDVSIITPFYNFIKQQPIKLDVITSRTPIRIGRRSFRVKFKRLRLPTREKERPRVFFVCNDELFGKRSRLYGFSNDSLRFLFFNLAALRLLDLLGQRPDVIHSHDWQAGLVPNLLACDRKLYPTLGKTATLFTIHNLAFQMGSDWWKVPAQKLDDGRGLPYAKPNRVRYLNFTKRGILHADVINTVSERYAQEILTPAFGQGLDVYLRRRQEDVYGVINGIDYAVFNPKFDDKVFLKYDWNSLDRKAKNKLALQRKLGLARKPSVPIVGVVNRLTEQKGFNLIMESIDALLRLPLQLVILGSGQKEYVEFFRRVARQHPRSFAFVSPFSEDMASKVFAGSDMFLMPSRFEPFGISPLISLRYGSVPIVHATGGLTDTITDFSPKTRVGNGFVFRQYAKEDFLIALARALETYRYEDVWTNLVWRSMQQSFSWELPARKYVELYRKALAKRRKPKR